MHVQIGSSGTLACSCTACSRWKLYLKGELPRGPTWRQHEVWTRSYVQALAGYIRHAGALTSAVGLSLAGCSQQGGVCLHCKELLH